MAAAVLGTALTACHDEDLPAGGIDSYSEHIFVANDAAYQPSVATNASFIDSWGIAIRPAGVPGHFWVLAGNKSYEYVGDVTGKTVAPCSAVSQLCGGLAPLPTNEVSFPDFPTTADGSGAPDIVNNHATGVVFNGNSQSFVITQTPSPASTDVTPVTNGAAFLFATNYGAIYAWTERKNADGSFDRSAEALKVFDARVTGDGGQFYGLAISPNSDRLYVADFGSSFSVRVFSSTLVGGQLQEITAGGFKNPFITAPAAVQAGDYVPWNVQTIGTSVFVAYVQVQQDPSAATGVPFPANEVHAAAAGRLVEFDLDGNLIAVWDDSGMLVAPWGMAVAPANFGALSNRLLVGNFGDYDGVNLGAIVAFDMKTKKAVNYLRATDGTPMLVPGIWGMLFGNGYTLGDSNALYFASGPNGELDGAFGSIRYDGG